MDKPFLGVIHLQALPSAHGHRDMPSLIRAALADAEALVAGGADGAVVENFGDAPFHKGTVDDPVPPDVSAGLAVVARLVRLETGLPVAVNCLRTDGVAALGAAVVAGARWIRVNVLSGAYLTDQGVIEGEAARLMAYRRRLGGDVRVLADLFVKHAQPLAPVDLAVAAKDLAQRSGCDGLILTGSRTGEPVDPDLLESVREAVGDFPIWIGSGMNPELAPSLWPRCDGAIVGTWLRRDGLLGESIDPDRVRRMRAALAVRA